MYELCSVSTTNIPLYAYCSFTVSYTT